MWKTIVNVLCEYVGHAFGFPDCHPPCFGVAVLALGLQVEAFWFLACVLGVWWFENWIVDASKNSETVFWFCLFLLLSISTGSILVESLDRFVIV